MLETERGKTNIIDSLKETLNKFLEKIKTKRAITKEAKDYGIIDKSSTHGLDDLLSVGPEKPLGYLPLITIRNECKVDVNKLTKFLELNGKKTALFKEDECRIGSGALFAYDQEKLQSLLTTNAEILKKYNWTTDANLFVKYIARVNANYKTQSDLFNLIADAFGDSRNILRDPRN
jgi:hypothetical protein